MNPYPMNELFSLKGQVALVTGSSRGIGYAIARALAHHGAHVVMTGRDSSDLEAQAGKLRDENCSASFTAFDVADLNAARSAVDGVVAEYGKIDIMVSNVGASLRKELGDITPEEFRDATKLNLDSAFILAQASARHMVPRGYGRLIFVGSIYGIVSRPKSLEYATGKEGLRGMARALAVELGPKGITSNVIAPGPTKTDRTQSLQDNAQFSNWVKERIPLGRWAEPEEQAGAAVFLASHAGGFCNGEVINIDGGMLVNAGNPW